VLLDVINFLKDFHFDIIKTGKKSKNCKKLQKMTFQGGKKIEGDKLGEKVD
jgi:hypothetical protein